jgi:beta-N-acetylhexosaminidase
MRRALAALVLVVLVFGVEGPRPDAVASEPHGGTGLRPRIVWRPIPFGPRRKRQTAAYSRRHYDLRGWALQDPQVIVEHYTDGSSFIGAWSHFARNGRHLGEKPGVCTHFIIDTDGTIYQLVPLDVKCRHAIGLNYTSIGIEHVGTSDGQVLRNRRQMRSSLRLTLWLMVRFDVNIGNVIGHAESLHSPYHLELYESWRCLTHADFPHPAMKKYRTRVRDLAASESLTVGPGTDWRPSGC